MVAKMECISAIEKSMNAMVKLHELETEAGEMTESKYREFMDLYHNERIKLMVLKGEHPAPDKPRRRGRTMRDQWREAV